MSVGPAWALHFERLDLERSFLVCRHIFGIYRSRSYIRMKVTGAESVSLYSVRGRSAFE